MLVCFCYKPGGIEAGGKRKKTKKKKLSRTWRHGWNTVQKDYPYPMK